MGNTFKKIALGLLLATVTSFAGTWINVTIEEEGVTLSDLASGYYADATETEVIYQANKKLLGKSRKIKKGMTLMIPVTEKFRDVPEHLSWR
ncbi:MAG TPA: hypothetical protein ENK94_03805 [Campylobacterales bacterium]|nr:hypothetical protein [Campylobacterales bacterium]